MYFENSKYKDMLKVCKQKYGEELGYGIYQEAEEYYKKFLVEADYRSSKMIEQHMKNNIFPILAYYRALLNLGMKQEQAYSNVLEQTQYYAQITKKKNQSLGKLVGAYFLFRIGVKKVMAKNFPYEGWETEWIKCDSKEIHFNLKRCLYYEVVEECGHPELCTVFCKNDTTAFEGFLPKIKFVRHGTIGEGKRMCDFHFFNNKS